MIKEAKVPARRENQPLLTGSAADTSSITAAISASSRLTERQPPPGHRARTARDARRRGGLDPRGPVIVIHAYVRDIMTVDVVTAHGPIAVVPS